MYSPTLLRGSFHSLQSVVSPNGCVLAPPPPPWHTDPKDTSLGSEKCPVQFKPECGKKQEQKAEKV